jgi:nucleoside-diphosphate-sugar epimerase
MRKVLVLGAGGQIGTELVLSLEKMFGKENVIASDIKNEPTDALKNSTYIALDVLDRSKLEKVVVEERITDVYLLAALLSATAEKNPAFAWRLNMDGLFNVLDLAKDKKIQKIFWPSSIAVFGPSTPKNATPQHTIMEPSTVYGISKQAGEQWCAYYFNKYGVDVRSIRYPGLISHTSLPGGGTTDYAVDIFYHAKKTGVYTSFLDKETALPMMYMEDAIRATIELMEAPKESISIRTSYNLAGISFTPEDLKKAIQKEISGFKINYKPDFRQEIADSWPNSIDDSIAQKDWNWKPTFNLEKMVQTMIEHVDISKLKML